MRTKNHSRMAKNYGIVDFQQQKYNDAQKILKNNTYMEESGLMKNLCKTLSKLSKNDLVNLDLIIQIKLRDKEIEVEND